MRVISVINYANAFELQLTAVKKNPCFSIDFSSIQLNVGGN